MRHDSGPAIEAAVASGKVARLAAGTYPIWKNVTISTVDAEVVGVGRETSILEFAPGYNLSVASVQNPYVHLSRFMVRHNKTYYPSLPSGNKVIARDVRADGNAFDPGTSDYGERESAAHGALLAIHRQSVIRNVAVQHATGAGLAVHARFADGNNANLVIVEYIDVLKASGPTRMIIRVNLSCRIAIPVASRYVTNTRGEI
jgi:hypothetical protein